MKITSSIISLSSQQTNISTSTQYSHLKTWDKTRELDESAHRENGKQTASSRTVKDRLDINPDLLQKNLNQSDPVDQNKDDLDKYLDDYFGDFRLKIFKDLVEMFTGKKIEVFNPNDIPQSGDTEIVNSEQQTSGDEPVSSEAPQQAGWGIDYFYQETSYTKDAFSVQASGTVTTDTGKEIIFSTSLSMSRETYEEFSISLKAGDALIDPLMIDFTGTGAKLSENHFNFDLNVDGVQDSIAAPASGAGFLAYDKNGDGIINNGAELFGPSTNDGFSELALYDNDKNGWIDENDSVFKDLRIWEHTTDGTSKLSALLEKNIGAIYTGRVDTNLNLVDRNNDFTGKIRQSGVWLNEKTGAAGIIQEIDLVI